MDYAGLITKAFKITFKHKFLWFLGLLASFTEGISVPSFNFNLPDLSPLEKQQPTPSTTPLPVRLNFNSAERVLGAEVADWISSHLYLLITVAVLIFLFFIFILIISLMAKGGLVASVLKIEKEESASFGIGFKEGYHAFWRVLGIQLLIALLILFLIAFLGLPLVFLIIFKNYWGALALGLLFLPILIVVLVYLSILLMYALRFTISQKTTVVESIKKAHNLMTEFKKEVILVWLISVLIGLALGIVLVLISLLILLPVAALGVAVYVGTGLVGTLIYALTLGLIVVLGFLLISGIITTFQSSFWTLAFLGLTKKPSKILTPRSD